MKTFYEWSDDLERRYDTMPKWFFDHQGCRSAYLSYCEDYGVFLEYDTLFSRQNTGVIYDKD